MEYYRILALDGGGIRGVLSISLLKVLQDAQPGFLDKVDLFAGTSTGGILALALAAGKSLDEALTLYKAKGKQVFANSLRTKVAELGNLKGAQYSNHGLKEALTEEFGDLTLGELTKRVLVVTFDLDNDPVEATVLRSWKPKIFQNFGDKGSDGKEKVVDVALRTSAAPTFFPIFQGFIDGGVVANNPSMCALAQALDKDTGKQKLSHIALLSISTGGFPKYLTEQSSNWGLVDWVRPLIEIMLEGNVGIADYQCQRLLGEQRYLRVAPRLRDPISLDDLERIPDLEKVAQDFPMEKAIKFVSKYYA